MDYPKRGKLGLFLVAGILAASTSLFFFGWLAEEMLEADTAHFDAVVRTAIHGFASPPLTSAMEVFSILGSVAPIVALTVLTIALFIYFHRPRAAALLAIAMTGAAVLDEVLKFAFHRPRPVAFFGTSPGSYSFPSGHALGSMCFYGALALILSSRIASRAARVFLYLGAILLVSAIGISRIYLGVHYPSDVIAGYLAAIVWVGAVGIAQELIRRRGANGPERMGGASKSL
ncbi:MAG TPA: phosphatase PAP2 family protein [Terriglobia bacterium]|nr:phosphatase PAP2 family protein [Terriglobia bacterium]